MSIRSRKASSVAPSEAAMSPNALVLSLSLYSKFRFNFTPLDLVHLVRSTLPAHISVQMRNQSPASQSINPVPPDQSNAHYIYITNPSHSPLFASTYALTKLANQESLPVTSNPNPAFQQITASEAHTHDIETEIQIEIVQQPHRQESVLS